MVGDFIENCLDVGVGRVDLGLVGRRDFSGDGGGLADAGEKHLQRDERSVRKLDLVNVRSVLGNRQALRSPAGEPPDLTAEAELDRVNNAALAGTVRTGDGEGLLAESKVKFSEFPAFPQYERIRS